MSARRVAGIAGLLSLVAGCVAPSGREQAQAPQPQAPPMTQPPARPIVSMRPVEFTVEGALEQGGWIRGTVPEGTVSATLGDQPVSFAADGSFFAGIDRDSPATLVLEATTGDQMLATRTLRIAPRDWRIERVNAPLRGSVPSETFMAIRRPELARINTAREARSQTDGWRQRFVWPVKGRISGRFGSQRIYQGVPGSYHSGLDIAPGAGAAYVAPADGVVVLAAAEPFSLEGNLVIIDHGMGLNSAFLHSARLAVREGDRVRQGQTIGYVGATGRATGPHLHWSLKWQDSRLDPLLFLPPQ